jgi:hypothetical protein
MPARFKFFGSAGQSLPGRKIANKLAGTRRRIDAGKMEIAAKRLSGTFDETHFASDRQMARTAWTVAAWGAADGI